MRWPCGPAFACLADSDRTTPEVLTIQGADCGVGSGGVHIDEPETSWATRMTIRNELDGLDRSVRLEKLSKLVLCCAERQIPNVKRLSQF